mmetsp:Transcript_15178/g.49394  ORF Transcript_15178/g.49394 Transcript_15178/m.49394 type:complete len:225 (+) Transcript_15178:1022-1696(+)
MSSSARSSPRAKTRSKSSSNLWPRAARSALPFETRLGCKTMQNLDGAGTTRTGRSWATMSMWSWSSLACDGPKSASASRYRHTRDASFTSRNEPGVSRVNASRIGSTSAIQLKSTKSTVRSHRTPSSEIITSSSAPSRRDERLSSGATLESSVPGPPSSGGTLSDRVVVVRGVVVRGVVVVVVVTRGAGNGAGSGATARDTAAASAGASAAAAAGEEKLLLLII